MERKAKKQIAGCLPLPRPKPRRAIERFLLLKGSEPKKSPHHESKAPELRPVSFPEESPMNDTLSFADFVGEEDFGNASLLHPDPPSQCGLPELVPSFSVMESAMDEDALIIEEFLNGSPNMYESVFEFQPPACHDDVNGKCAIPKNSSFDLDVSRPSDWSSNSSTVTDRVSSHSSASLERVNIGHLVMADENSRLHSYAPSQYGRPSELIPSCSMMQSTLDEDALIIEEFLQGSPNMFGYQSNFQSDEGLNANMMPKESSSDSHASRPSHWSTSDRHMADSVSLSKEPLMEGTRLSSSTSSNWETIGDWDLNEILAKLSEIKSRGSHPFP